jgi:sn-glycerol 3-phosphate transport system ATP-binding protein
MADITFDNVVKSYGHTEVIHGIRGHIRDGEFIVIVGASGCGKSTLLRMLAGLETISAGEIRIDHARINELEPSKRDIAMVFQNYALYPHMTVYDNMAYGLKIRGLSKLAIHQKVHQAADILRLQDYLARKPRELSGGQRQRVAMGRAIVREPKVFLFDEPLSNLDAKLRVQMRLEIKQLQKRLGTTSVYVTHDQVEAMTLGDRLMVLSEGKVEQFGPPIELYERPQTQFVAGFIGSPAMNFLQAQRTEDGKSLLIGERTQINLCDALNPQHQQVTLGIRPEHVTLDDQGPLHIAIDLLEHLGAETLVHGSLLDSSQKFTALVQGYQTFTGLETLRFRIDPRQVHLFSVHDATRLN